ncbi:lipid A biosynthesis lauroyl acyltransferase [Paenibacillus konkukensis]|uniref:Lipid A biosynthesis lauroyl acyltransferase n=1 Tax=Paenibacillus konkukensis TaxID=2020716 RepID=A0ABY4RHK5_9BACL|nr:lipid A biosynthesis acyltransferase [Paenibacillus konkukensis]UQZ81647.1 lipid A biosynthesis lauroyl acyltransferase [Paenibacillus konkukensis]
MYEWIESVTRRQGLLKACSRCCGWMPRRLMLWICRWLGTALCAASANGVAAKVRLNMEDLLEQPPGSEIKMLRRRFFQNLIITLYEIMLESERLPGSERWRFRAEGEERLEEALLLGRGAIVYTPHCGNFFYYYWYLCQRYSCLTIATGGSAELLPLYEHFARLGCPGLDYDRTPPLALMKKLRAHLASNGVVFILGDFYRPSFPKSRLFGRTTRTPEGAAMLGIDSRTPVIPFYGIRERAFVHRLVFGQPLHLYAAYSRSGRSEAAQLLNGHMEEVIRRHPEQWFYWFNAEERWEEDEMNAKRSHTA